tara:strand:+ start:562 stop:1398 length:837 start_codon:yes stop_codon:yes gene_type:complete
MAVLFVADLYSHQINGGGENNDAVLINYLRDQGVDVKLAHTQELNPAAVDAHDTLIVSNFVLLSEEMKAYISANADYIIYEHDHKYVRTRDPSKFHAFLAPPEHLINVDFYRKARKVVVLSQICKEVIEKNLQLTNVHNIGTSLWSKEKFEFIRSAQKDKNKEYAVVNSTNPTKGTPAAVKFCTEKALQFEFIGSTDQYTFLRELAQFKVLVFIPQVLETFCRLVAEAKMLDCKVYTKKALIGFMSESIGNQSGEELIDSLEKRTNVALDYFYDLVKE